VVLCPGDAEDMWHAYNLICVGDDVTATTIRKVVKANATAVSSQRVRLTLTIRVSNVDFDPAECAIRLGGVNIAENAHVKLGAHHTIQLEPTRNFTIRKDSWDTVFLERLDSACNPVKQAQRAAVVMQAGLAHVCLITDHMTLLRAKIEKSIPKKRAGGKSHTEGMNKFFEMVLQAILREIDFDIVKGVILASPGYVKDDFFKYMMAEAAKRPELKVLANNKERFVLAHSSSGYKHALDQVLADPALQSQLLDSQAAKEVKVLNKFFRMLNDDSAKAFYSYTHVKAAHERGAIESLLVTDSLFRSSDIKTRKRYVNLLEAVRDSGANVFLFSALHPSGEQLDQISGVAAILRFPIPELDDLEIEELQQQEPEKDPYAMMDDAELESGDEDDTNAVEASAGAGLPAQDHRTMEERDAEEAVQDMF